MTGIASSSPMCGSAFIQWLPKCDIGHIYPLTGGSFSGTVPTVDEAQLLNRVAIAIARAPDCPACKANAPNWRHLGVTRLPIDAGHVSVALAACEDCGSVRHWSVERLELLSEPVECRL